MGKEDKKTAKKAKKAKEDSLVDNLELNFENITGNDIGETEEEPEFDEFFSGLTNDLEQMVGFEESEETEDVSDEEEPDEELVEEDEEPEDTKTKSDPEIEKLKQYKDFLPLLEVMMSDPKLVSIVKDYLTGESTEGQATDNSDFEIPEDFIFDFEEAIKDPNSESGKLLNRYVQMQVKQTMNAELSKEKQQAALEDQKRRVIKKFGITEQEVEDLIEWSMQTPLTLEDAYYLKNRSKIEKEVAKNAINSALKKKSSSHRSLSSKGKPGRQAEPESELFKLIKGSIEFGGGALE